VSFERLYVEATMARQTASHHAGLEKVYIPMSASALTTIIAVTQESIERPAIPSNAMPGPRQRVIRWPAFGLMIPSPNTIFGQDMANDVINARRFPLERELPVLELFSSIAAGEIV
jgi:hypothetical protein